MYRIVPSNIINIYGQNKLDLYFNLLHSRTLFALDFSTILLSIRLNYCEMQALLLLSSITCLFIDGRNRHCVSAPRHFRVQKQCEYGLFICYTGLPDYVKCTKVKTHISMAERQLCARLNYFNFHSVPMSIPCVANLPTGLIIHVTM